MKVEIVQILLFFFQYKQHNYTEDSYKQEELTLPHLLEIDLSKVSV